LTKLRAIIVDDELAGRENLRAIVESYCPEIEVLNVAESVLKGKELISANNPDLVFLDISMPVLDGFDLLDQFENRNFMVVFVSAHEEFGIKAVKAGAADYLLKPINIKELKKTIRHLLSIHEKLDKISSQLQNERLVLPCSHGFDVIVIDDIIRLEADGCYTKIIIKESKNRIISRTLKDFEDSLPKCNFFRIHKANLINLKYIKEYSNIGGNYVTMTDGSRVEISRRKAPEFIQRIKAVLNAV